jgi:hypothetical protein
MTEDKDRDQSKPLTAFSLGMMGLVVFLRVLPHLLAIPYPWSAAPATAFSLYGGARLRFWSALTLPLLMMAGADLLIWWLHGWSSQWLPFDVWVYASLFLSVLIGRFLANTKSPWRIAIGTVLAATQFFLVTNFGSWLHSRAIDPNEIPQGSAMVRITQPNSQFYDVKYANNAQGLAMCYLMGVKFTPEQGAPLGFGLPLFLSDLFFSGLMFGAYSGVSHWLGRPATAMSKQPEVAT